MAAHTLASHHGGVAVGEHHRARGGVFAWVCAADLSRGRAADYISIVALTPSGKIPIVRQYRPALEAFAWELPAGLVDPGEDPADGCRRELLEETGFTARAVHALGENSACTGRLNNRIHNFFVEAGERTRAFEPE